MQGKKYFDCPPNHGIFVRQTQLAEINDQLQVTSPRTLFPSVSSGLTSPRKLGFTPSKVCVNKNKK